MEEALFTFAVGFTRDRPIRPDERTTHIMILGEDSARGLSEARQTAIAWTMFRHRSPMVTSIRLVAAEV